MLISLAFPRFMHQSRVAPHTHPYAEAVTVISGTLGHGMGDKVEATGELLKPGGLFALPAKQTWPRGPLPLCGMKPTWISLAPVCPA